MTPSGTGDQHLIDLYTAGTGNGHRAALVLEESGLRYHAHKLNLQAGEQKKPEFLAVNPAGAIPAIVDSDAPDKTPANIAHFRESPARFDR